MKFTANTAQFSELLTGVLPAVSTRSTLPSLSHFLVEAKSGNVSIYATDLEIGIESSIETNVEKEGAATLPARRLTDIVGVIETEDFALAQTTESQCEIKSTDNKTKFKVMAGEREEFPVIPELKEDISVEIDVERLKEGIEKTIFSVSRDESRYVLCGIFLESDGENLNMISTDGRRLSMFKTKLEGNSKKFKAIVPTKATSILDRALAGDEGKVKINICDKENQIYFSFGSTVIYSRLIEGDYPNYNQVIPEKSTRTVTVETEAIYKATRQMTAVTTKSSLAVKYKFAKNKAVVSVNAPEIGSGTSSIDVEYGGDEIEISFNPEYVINMLKVIKSQKMNIDMTTAINPGKFTPASEDESYTGVIMPMRP